MISKHRQLCWFFVICMVPLQVLQAQTQVISLKDALETRGTVIFFRHALAPGFGDPTNFKVDDCLTQRNLDIRGREQAKRIGGAFKVLDFATDTVHSSPWCRCLETARLMDIGPVESFDGLSSFFEGHVDRQATLKLLSDKLLTISNRHEIPAIMITHQVVIRAITRLVTSSGEAILYYPKRDISSRIRLTEND
ncbi:MAG TPA: histidine phosphatase family protein [Gammaproteobacteria bacterium]|nr:histidine phosphatase family protein [Gammaproteobacteria bacterium]